MRGIIFKILAKQINKKITETERDLTGLNNLVCEAMSVQNIRWQRDLEKSIEHHEAMLEFLHKLLLVF